jgi:integrase/recombinase XerC
MYQNRFCSPMLPKRNPNGNHNLKADVSIFLAIQDYLRNVADSRSVNTYSTYFSGMNLFQQVLIENGIDIQNETVSTMNETMFNWFLNKLRDKAPATENLYVTAILGMYEFMYMEYPTNFDVTYLYLLQKKRMRRDPEKVLNIPYDEMTEFLNFVEHVTIDEKEKIDILRSYRDRCFLLLLGDSGLRVNEACNITLGNIDFGKRRIEVIGKGQRIMVAIISKRVRESICDYLSVRGLLDENGKIANCVGDLNLFAKHNINTKNVSGVNGVQISSQTGESIVAKWIGKVLGQSMVECITPHTFRHYFLTKVVKLTGNLKLAQILGNHKNIETTKRYVHYSNRELNDIFGEDFFQ